MLKRLLTMSGKPNMSVKLLTQVEAQNIDKKLFDQYQFSVYQLMELAGLSCANSIAQEYPLDADTKPVLIVCGVGNNGGDGLVCARHLALFGYKVKTVMYKEPANDLIRNMLTQSRNMGNELIDLPSIEASNKNYSLIVDAVLGFGFKPPLREDLMPIMKLFNETTVPICSIDIPSGWHVENGPPADGSFQPDMLVSLTAPKLCALHFKGRFHYLGGRFVPPALAAEYSLNLPRYPGISQTTILYKNTLKF